MSLIVDADNPAAPAVNPADVIKDGDSKTFMQDVATASHKSCVVAIFWADDCGPSQTLMPMLEKLILQTNGVLKLVKVNIDQNQELAHQMRVQKSPSVYAFQNGQPVDGFQGALSEAQLRNFIARVSGHKKGPLEAALEQAKELLDGGDFQNAGGIYQQVLGQDASHPAAIGGFIRCLIGLGEIEKAREAVDNIPADLRKEKDIVATITAVELAEQGTDAGDSDTAALEQKLDKNENDHQARFDLAIALYGAGKTEEAINHLLESIKRDQAWNNQAAKDQLLKIFDGLGFNDPLAQEGRRKLSTILFV